jgi:hypothetical protein
MSRTIYGEGSIFYFLTLAGTALILLMAANTSYADFPRLAALAANDGFLPRQLALRGSRLVFSWGIVLLAMSASLLVVFANASTTALIPLYAVGVFMSFTISQTGMVIRGRRISQLKPGESVEGLETDLEYDANWRWHVAISAIGATCTGVVMIVFAVTKFKSGAWFIVFLIPSLVYLFFRIHRHYQIVAERLSLGGEKPDLAKRSVQTLILVDNVHAETARVVNFAESLGHPWRAIHISLNEEKTAIVRQKWNEYIGKGELIMIPSPYRLLAEPIQDYILQLQEENPGCFVHILMGSLMMDTFWEQTLHQNTAVIFNLALGRMENVAITSVPYQIHHLSDHKDDPALSESDQSVQTEAMDTNE